MRFRRRSNRIGLDRALYRRRLGAGLRRVCRATACPKATEEEPIATRRHAVRPVLRHAVSAIGRRVRLARGVVENRFGYLARAFDLSGLGLDKLNGSEAGERDAA